MNSEATRRCWARSSRGAICSGGSPTPWPTTRRPGSMMRSCRMLNPVRAIGFSPEMLTAASGRSWKRSSHLRSSTFPPRRGISSIQPSIRISPSTCAAHTASATRSGSKVMKLLWDAIGSEFGGRHGLYETNYAGNHEDIRIQALWHARGSGTLDSMIALADRCLADYDENGWRNPAWLNSDDVAQPGITGTAAE